MLLRRLSVVVLATLAWAPTAAGGVAIHSDADRGRASATRADDADSARVTARRRYPLIAAAGDISCESSHGDRANCKQRATSNLFRGRRLAAILTLGDNQYQDGRYEDFRRYFHPTWGRFRGRTRPSPGNHDYETHDAEGYFDYFGRRAGPRRRGYYSFNIGRWHLISLSSECSDAGGCSAGSPQYRWLRRDLRQRSRRCTLAYWHHPRFSSGDHGNQDHVAPFWTLLYRYRADVVLNGHDHTYERFASQTPRARHAPRRGIRQWVVGTGGANHYPFRSRRPNSRVRNSQTFGALFLRLRPRSYRFTFVPIAGQSFRDSGSFRCH
jgi:hypothetical protein